MSGTVVPEAVEAMAALDAAFDRFAAADLTGLSKPDLLLVMDAYQRVWCRMPGQWNRLLTALLAITTAVAMGARNWKQVLATRWRTSTAEAHRWLALAKELGPRTALTGEPLAPLLPAIAAAQEAGAINAEHVKELRDSVHQLPSWVDAPTRTQFEVDLVRVALKSGPAEVKAEAARLLFLMDQDGPEPDDRERDKARGVRKGRQRRNGNTPYEVEASPELAAGLGAFFAKFAAPGMCNPDDPQPCTSGRPSQAQIDNDHRSLEQRRHDALTVMTRIALSTDLGTLNGLPVQILVKTTLQELQSTVGVAICGDGTWMTPRDLIRLGAHAHWSLAVFDEATGSAMDLFRAKRTASPAQRLMLIARDWGCTKPGCPVGPYGCQVHHAQDDWIDGGQTNVDHNALVCGGDHGLLGPGAHQHCTEMIDGVCHWIPPEGLDTGQARINYRNRPDLIPVPDPDAPWPWDTPTPADAAESVPDTDTPTEPDSGSESEPDSAVDPWDEQSPPFPPLQSDTPPSPVSTDWNSDEPPFPPLESDTPPESTQSSAVSTTAPHPTPECRPTPNEPTPPLPSGDDLDTDVDTDDSDADEDDENDADTDDTHDNDRVDSTDENARTDDPDDPDDEDSGYVRIRTTPSGFTILRTGPIDALGSDSRHGRAARRDLARAFRLFPPTTGDTGDPGGPAPPDTTAA